MADQILDAKLESHLPILLPVLHIILFFIKVDVESLPQIFLNLSRKDVKAIHLKPKHSRWLSPTDFYDLPNNYLLNQTGSYYKLKF